MLNFLFVGFIFISALYLFLSPRKEVPLVIILHAFFQYVMTLGFWLVQMNTYFAGMLLGFMVTTSVLLVWARNLNYSKDLLSIRLFFTLTQWTALVAVVIFIVVKSPYYYMVPSSSWQDLVDHQQLSIHPAAKLCGNVLLFTTFFHLVLGWGQRWSASKSFWDLSPLFLYFLLMSFLRIFQQGTEVFPYS
ncbi:MAG: hypothetical protein AAFR61_18665 [Bacteroidota bacterium]